jgi:lipoate-protein ligase A
LGSTQNESDINPEQAMAHGVDIVRRRSGGGVVYVHPDASIWCDITIPRDDLLWTDDVATSVYRNEFLVGDDGRTVCCASTSPGEVFAGSSKVVGISQRRTRQGARFQCVVYRQWNPEQWVDCLASPDLAQRVGRLPVAPVDVTPEQLMTSLVTVLSRTHA